MKISIKEVEIVEAIKNYLGNQGIVTTGKEMAVKFTVGRGLNGTTKATVKFTQGTGTPTPAAELNTMRENFSLKSKDVEEALEEVEEIINTEAAKEPEAELEPLPEMAGTTVEGEDEVENLFKV